MTASDIEARKEAWLLRLQDETRELYQRKQKLAAFLPDATAGSLSQENMTLMAFQLPVMEAYYRILMARLELAGVQVYFHPDDELVFRFEPKQDSA